MADAVIIIFWLICLIRGVFRGPVNELFSISGIFGGLVVAAWVYLPLAAIIPVGIGSEHLRRTISFFAVFSAVFALLSVSGIVAVYLMHLRHSGWLQRAFGAGLGICKGFLAVAVLLVPLVAFFPQESSWFGRSTLFPFENWVAEKVATVTPAPMHRQFDAHIDDYK